jgi:macrodomain Ter protein organizer (MatP/YcbG family)
MEASNALKMINALSKSKSRVSSEAQNIIKQQINRDLNFARWQKLAVHSALKATCLEQKLIKLLKDPRISNATLIEILKRALAQPEVQELIDEQFEEQKFP